MFFFFQAEDGIRDYKVTGVQTCALPISRDASARRGPPARRARRPAYRPPQQGEIGRASCRERVQISVVAVSLKKKTNVQGRASRPPRESMRRVTAARGATQRTTTQTETR